MNNYDYRNNRLTAHYYSNDNNHFGYSTANARKCALYSKGKSRTSAFISIMRFLYLVYKTLEKVLSTDGFAAGFIGVSLMLIVGIAGGVQLGVLTLGSGVIFSGILLCVVSVFIYNKNRE